MVVNQSYLRLENEKILLELIPNKKKKIQLYKNIATQNRINKIVYNFLLPTQYLKLDKINNYQNFLYRYILSNNIIN